MGGVFTKQFRSSVTHLVTNLSFTVKYEVSFTTEGETVTNILTPMAIRTLVRLIQSVILRELWN